MAKENIKGLTIELGLDASGVDTELEKIKDSLNKTSIDLGRINNSLKLNPDSVEAWKKKQTALNNAIKQTQDKITAQNRKLQETKSLVDKGILDPKEIEKIKKEILKSNKELNKFNMQLEECGDKISTLPVKKLEDLGSSLTRNLTAPILASVGALTALTMATANEADAIGDMATNLGMSTEELYRWHYISEILAVDSDVLHKAFTKFNVMLGDISAGTASKNITDALSKIGLTVDDLKGKDLSSAFETVRDALAGLEDSSLRVAIANEIFGDKMGTSLQQLLSASSDEIDNLSSRIEDLGLITTEQANMAGEFNDKISDLKYAFKGMAVELMTAMLPIMQDILNFVKDKIIPMIKGFIEHWNGMSDGAKNFSLSLVGILAALGPVISIVAKALPLIKGLKVGLAAVGTSGYIAGAGINFATLGIGALIAILTTALLKSKEFQNTIAQIGDMVVKLLNVVFTLLRPIFDMINGIVNAVSITADILFGGSGSGSSNTTNNAYNSTTNNNSFVINGANSDDIVDQINASLGGIY